VHKPDIPAGVRERTAEAAARAWLIVQEAMRRFFALPDEQQIELWVQGVGWTPLEEEVAKEWGWNLLAAKYPEHFDPVVRHWLDGGQAWSPRRNPDHRRATTKHL